MKQKRIIQSDNKESVRTGRREFLSKLWKLLGLIALTEFAFFTVNLLKPGKKNISNGPSLLKVFGSVEDFPKSSVTPDRINKLFLIRLEDGGFLALSLTCSHLGCSVLWDDAKKQFICPCHSSAFDKYGNVINSPAPRPLDYYPVIIEAGKIKIDMNQKKKRREFDKSQLTYAI